MRNLALSRLNRHLTHYCSAIALLACATSVHAQEAEGSPDTAAVDDIVVGAIDTGLLALVGVEPGDGEAQIAIKRRFFGD